MESNDGGPGVLFAARTSLGNALAAEGASPSEVARSNLETATAVWPGTLLSGRRTTLACCSSRMGRRRRPKRSSCRCSRRSSVLGPSARHADGGDAGRQLGARRATTPPPRRSTTPARGTGAGGRRRRPVDVIVGMNLASALLGAGKYTDAEAAVEANLEAKRRRLGPEHVDTLMAQMVWASCCASGITSGRVHPRRECGGEGARAGRGHLDTWTARLNLAATLLESRDRLTGDAPLRPQPLRRSPATRARR